jgi:hypothetical protein
MLSHTLWAGRRAMSRIDLGKMFSCFESFQWFQRAAERKGVPTEAKLDTAVEMLEQKVALLVREEQVATREAALLARANRTTEAKEKLRVRQSTRQRLAKNQGVLHNLRQMQLQVEDTKMWAFSIEAMSSVANEYNYSSANLDGLYKQVTSSQDQMSEFHEQSAELNAVLSQNVDPLAPITEEDLEAEFEDLMRAQAVHGGTTANEPEFPALPAFEHSPAMQVMAAPVEVRGRFDLEPAQ